MAMRYTGCAHVDQIPMTGGSESDDFVAEIRRRLAESAEFKRCLPAAPGALESVALADEMRYQRESIEELRIELSERWGVIVDEDGVARFKE